jgi:aminocarboxymuconate-semialdehyde decarboxylase
MKIDFHCHAFPSAVLHALNRYYPDAVQIRNQPDGTLYGIHNGTLLQAWDWDPLLRIEDIDRAGVDVELLSCPPAYAQLDDHLPEICRLVNDALADSCRRNPDRLRAFAHLPFNDLGMALQEMARCLDQLGFVGVVIASNIGGHYLDEPQFEPFWKEANRRRVPVFLHPVLSPCYHDDLRPPLLQFPFDSTLAATRLICRGLYERFPDVVLIISHLGGALPYLARRIDLGFEIPAMSSPEWKITRPPSEHMKRLFLDTALGWNRGAFNCARELVGIERLVFGTDYFVRGSRFMERTSEFLDSLGLKSAERELIYSGNAERILNMR